MKLSEKIVVAARAVESIARHDDEEAAVREAALDRVQQLVDAERAALRARVQARLQEQLGAPAPQAA